VTRAVVAFSLIGVCCARAPELNLVLLTIDTCRADRLGCYGYARAETPNIDRLADEGVLFEEARTCVPITLPSHVSIMAACYPTVHGVRDNGAYITPDSLVTLAEVLREAGYSTAAFVGSFPVESRFNLDQGFDHYGDVFTERRGLSKEGPGGVSIFFHERPATAVNAEFFAWLDDGPEAPFFAWLHYFDPHQPYEPRPPYDAICAGRPYDAEIAFVDACVGGLRRQLEDRGLLERTVVVITSDHGESLGDHGERSHALLLYDPTLRVPLIIRCPGERRQRRRVADQVRTIDIAPTLLELLDAEPPPSWRGSSLVSLMNGRADAGREQYYETLFGRLHFGWSVLAGYQAGQWKYVHGPAPELYNTAEDRGEQINVVADHPQIVDELRSKLLGFMAESAEAGQSLFREPDRETAERLEALGYVASWQPAGGEDTWFTGPNPVDMMPAHEWFNIGRNYVHEGLWLEATQAFYRALEANPSNKDARLGLVHAYARLGEASAALQEAAKALALDPCDGPLRLSHARLLLGQNQPTAALEDARRALRDGADPFDAWMLVGECHEAVGASAAAMDAYRRALQVDPSHFRARFALARVLATRGQLDEAEEEFLAAVGANPYWALGRHNYGVFLSQHGRTEEAAEQFRIALRLNPTYVAAHHALAVLLAAEGRTDEAATHLEAVRRYAADPERKRAAADLLATFGQR
jgi:arylsulfatase A-like enzyme/Tfp pilus assembly protein PilF